MDNQRLANVLEDLVELLRNNQQEAPQAAQAAVGREVDEDAPDADDTVEVSAGDLWKLVNRARKMIRFAREGKVPSQKDRAPLCQSIKALKADGLAKKPKNLRD